MLAALFLGCTPQQHVAVSALGPAELAEDQVVCVGIQSENGQGSQVMLVGMDSATEVPLVDVDADWSFQVDGLALLGDHVAVCAPTLTRVDLATGDIEQTDIYCDAVADYDGAIVLFHGCDEADWEACDYDQTWRDPIRSYPTWEDALADTNGATIPSVPYATRLGRGDDVFLSAWHATDEVERWDAATGTLVETTALQGFDTWVWGLSAVGDRLFVVNDGRDPGWSWNTRIAEFDADGDAVQDLRLGEHVAMNGLACTDTLIDAATIPVTTTGGPTGGPTTTTPGTVIVEY